MHSKIKLLILFIMLFSSCTSSFRHIYKEEVSEGMKQLDKLRPAILSIEDLAPLPIPVQKYIIYTGAVGKPRISTVYIKANGRIRSNPEDPWMSFQSEQVNFMQNPKRVFYIKARKKGIPASGLHLYKDAIATMQIKVAGIFKVVDAKGVEMNQGETVTVFNDMCFMAPGSLIDKRITWETIDLKHVKAVFRNQGISIGADLFFDEEGKLTNFISNDRFETSDGKRYMNYPWITPVKSYGEFHGYSLPAKADVIYKRPGGEFCYLEFEMIDIQYNTNLNLQ